MSEENKSVLEVEQFKLKDSFKLDELVKEANTSLLREKREEAIQSIRKLFSKAAGIAWDINKKQQEIKKATDKLNKVQEKINQLKQGNWSVLAEIEQLTKDQN